MKTNIFPTFGFFTAFSFLQAAEQVGNPDIHQSPHLRMQHDGTPRPCGRSYLQVPSRKADRLSHFVEIMLLFSKIERGNARSVVREAPVSDLLESMRDRVEGRIATAGMTLAMDPSPLAAGLIASIPSGEHVSSCVYLLREIPRSGVSTHKVSATVLPMIAASNHSVAVTAACRMIESPELAPSLAELANAAELSRFHFQFLLDKKPRSFRGGGIAEMIRFAIDDCSLGSILVASSVKGICCITLGDDPDYLLADLRNRFRMAEFVGGDRNFEELVAKVIRFIEAPKLGLDLPLDIRGTAFQQQVWQALRKIPLGSTTNYSEIAKRIGSPKSVRAVAGACAANSIAVAIPCHRVIRTNGNPSGYRWGVDRKRALLDREITA